MKKITPRLPKGHRDFLPDQVRKRNYLLDHIRTVFGLYGFEEIETPAVEQMETLTGKYGEEGDRLLFKILDSGDYLQKADPGILAEKDSRTLTAQISSKGLRYDLTVPLARYVVQHQNELTFPFRRFHIGPVWRADRPQKGRYREFYQCDADIIGSTSLLNETELTAIFLEVFERIGLPVTVQVNHRKILEAIVQAAGVQQHYGSILIAMDKLDKIGEEGVRKELRTLGLSQEVNNRLFELFSTIDLEELQAKLASSPAAAEGIAALQTLAAHADDERLVFNPTLARGLDYYTGTIWEVKATDADMGTIAAGGRYDDLTEMFGGRDMSGVGISFGIERIYDILEAENGFPDELALTTKALVINFGEALERAGWTVVQALRHAGIAAELYPDAAKLKKQMTYANNKRIPYVIFIGEEELQSGEVQLKHMASGVQEALLPSEAIRRLQ